MKHLTWRLKAVVLVAGLLLVSNLLPTSASTPARSASVEQPARLTPPGPRTTVTPPVIRPTVTPVGPRPTVTPPKLRPTETPVGPRPTVTPPKPRPTVTPPTAAEISALQNAIAEEYLALNTYHAVLRQYSNMAPFVTIAASEQQHVNALAGLFTKYGLAIPANPGSTAATSWSSRQAACQTGVNVEKEDIALYDHLSGVVTMPDIVRVFSNLRAASLNNHLPAFEACN